MTSATNTVEGPKVKGSHKLLAVVGVLLGVMLVGLVLFSHEGLYRIYSFQHQRLVLDRDNARLAEENARLARTIDRLQNDPEMIQDLIRRDLNFVKKNEIIFQFPPGSRRRLAEAGSTPGAGSLPEALARPETPPKPDSGWSWKSLEGAPQRSSHTPPVIGPKAGR
jgi:cell division protein FtsB